ncbi:MAG: Mrp/NBP35 family ATP-binding protein [Prevotellaceae bacterium]|jgi:ATP-binding protein involved in chromosome partitioning|nr:Mrp/NBP35 family ATP-binding protein [Prevotellaceae bacterium]
MARNIDIITDLLSEIKHPETGRDIVSLGIVQNLKAEDKIIAMSLVFKPNDAFVTSIKKAVEDKLKPVFPDAELQILDLKRQLSKTPKKEYPDVKVKNIIAVASGKGGVGKSTVAVNLAIALSQRGFKTGLLDADVYGPSIPTMLDMHDARPVMIEKDGFELIEPVEKFGIKCLSIGFFLSPDDAVIWRGPAATSALKQLAKQSNWDGLDFLLIDLPPGTGDVHLTITQELDITAAIIVTTPQKVALADVLRGTNMFRNKDINVPVAGLIENMAWFTPEELPDHKYYIFGRNGGKRMAEELEISFLGEIPLVQSIRESGDSGIPVVRNDNVSAAAFQQIVDNLLQQPMIKNN